MRGANLVLPTHLTFESSGSCGVKPIVNAARLQFSPMMNQSNPTTLVLCEPNCIIVSNGITYDFEIFGDITIPNAKDDMMGMQQPCPSPSSVITATYIVTYTSPGKLCVHHAYMYMSLGDDIVFLFTVLDCADKTVQFCKVTD